MVPNICFTANETRKYKRILSYSRTPEYTEYIHNYSLISSLPCARSFVRLFVCAFIFYIFIAVEYVYRYDGICRACLLVNRLKNGIVFFSHSQLFDFVKRLHSLSHRCIVVDTLVMHLPPHISSSYYFACT